VVVEIKHGREEEVGNLVEEGLKQIRDRKYYEKYAIDKVILLAIGFWKGREISCKFTNII
jgi:hypothetical protein